ncbi:alpha/beta hydrolase [Pelagibacteraceae bacterium]|nr:alpha/beta hydrolase [Pelagibacteraceae bacterium]
MNNDLDCHFTQTGEGPGLFLIHGIGAAEDAWRFIVPKLTKYFTVITYDLRGHGKSTVTNNNFTLNDLIDDLEKIREKTKIEKAHFMGHSLGGMIAPAYANKFPDNTISVGLLSTVADRSTKDKQKVLDIIKKMELGSIPEILSTLTNRWFTDDFIKKNKSIVDQRIQQVTDTNPEVFLNVFKIYAETEMISWLKEIKKPCLVLTGENDLGCSPEHNKKISSELINSKLVILPDVKHSILLEEPDETASNILKFLLTL